MWVWSRCQERSSTRSAFLWCGIREVNLLLGSLADERSLPSLLRLLLLLLLPPARLLPILAGLQKSQCDR